MIALKEGVFMIDWIIGGIIFALTLFIVVKNIIAIKKGKTTCSCGHCPSSNSCDKKYV